MLEVTMPTPLPCIAWREPLAEMSAEDFGTHMCKLAHAFGGFSQVAPLDVARSLAGQINNNGGYAPTHATIAAWHYARWGDVQAWESGDDERWASAVIDVANAQLAYLRDNY